MMEFVTIDEVIDNTQIPEDIKKVALEKYYAAGRIYDKHKGIIPPGIEMNHSKQEYQIRSVNDYFRMEANIDLGT